MDPTTLNTLITVVGGGGVLGGAGWLFSNLLKNKDDQIQRILSDLKAKAEECDQERTRADQSDQKYVQVLLADIEERKSRDRTIELLSRAASRNNRGPFDEE